MFWFLLLVAVQAGNPTTVNGIELGPVEDFRTDGPARVCIQSAAVDLQEGEAAYLQYAGIHKGILRIASSEGYVEVAHGDSWAELSRRQLLYRDGDTSVYRARLNGALAYLFFAPTEYSDGGAVPILSVTGELIDGGQDDLELLHRILIFLTLRLRVHGGTHMDGIC